MQVKGDTSKEGSWGPMIEMDQVSEEGVRANVAPDLEGLQSI